MSVIRLRRQLACLLITLLAIPLSQAAAALSPQQSSDRQSQAPASQQPGQLETRPQSDNTTAQQPAT